MNARLKYILPCLGLLALLAGCRRNEMHQQAIMKALQSSDFFADGRASRNPVPGTVARGHLETDHAFFEGKMNGQLVDTFPFPVTQGVLERGHQRLIFTAPSVTAISATAME